LQIIPASRSGARQFQQALDCAGREGALSWELPAATNLAGCEAAALLQPVYSRFTEGLGKADLKERKVLLHILRYRGLAPRNSYYCRASNRT
jgi:hypothetical protein